MIEKKVTKMLNEERKRKNNSQKNLEKILEIKKMC